MLKHPILLAFAVLVMVNISDAETHKECGVNRRVVRSCCQVNRLLLACCTSHLKRFLTSKNVKNCSYDSSAFLFLLILILSKDIESNPGPGPALVQDVVGNSSTVFPCGSCEQPVTWTCKGVECDFCYIWYHADCQNISDSMYDRLGNESAIGAWKCLACDNMNITTPSCASLETYHTPNKYASLNLTNTGSPESITAPTLNHHPHTSTPKHKEQTRYKQSKNKIRRSLKVLVVNCRSIIDKKLEYENMIMSTKPDIILGTESWLKPKHYDNEIFDPLLEYTPFRRDRQDQTGGGVFIAVKNTLIAQEASHLHTDCENLWVKIEIQGTKPLLVGCYYKPKENDQHSMSEFQKSLCQATKTNATIWVGGDFNMPKMNWCHISPSPDCRNQSLYREFIDILYDANLSQVVQEPTRENHILDLFLTNNPSIITRCSVIPGISDHDAVLIESSTSARMRPQKPRKIHLYNKADWDGLRNHMECLHTTLIHTNTYNNTSTGELWQIVTEELEKAISRFVPSKMASTKNKLPWIKRDLKRLYRRRDKAYKKYKGSGSSQLREKYLSLKHLCRRETRISYQKYLEEILKVSPDSDHGQTRTRPNNKKLFSLLKHSKQDSSGIDTLKKHNKLHTADTDKAHILNEQFQSVFTTKSPLSLKRISEMKVQGNMDVGRDMPLQPPSPHAPMPDIDISVNGVEKLLCDLNPHKAAGPDQIKPIVLKNAAKALAPIVTELFKKSLSTHSLPDIWKTANVAPIFKKGSRSDPANYRPISLTCILCKTMEHIIASSITKHFTQNNLFYELQHGFREKRSCQTQLIMLVEDLLQAVNSKSQIDLILLDFSKAFDMVNHEKLLYKLHHFGIRGHTLSWIKSFLDNRSQSVLVNGSMSSTIPVPSGVPQGSVLGPLLFLIYINDLPDFVKHSKVRLFADDTAIYLTMTISSHSRLLQEDLCQLEKWESLWNMSFNPSKCQVIQITKRKSVIPTTYTLHNTTLETVSSAKYLGVTISKDMTWNTHIDNITRKANQTLAFLRRNIKIHSEALKSNAYKTLVRPQLEYSAAVWAPHTGTLIEQVESVQRRAARWAKRDYRRTSSVSEMLTSLNWRRLDQRRIDQRLVLLHNIINKQVAIGLPDYVIPQSRPSRNSHPQAFQQIQTKTDYYKFSFFPRTIVHWNALPPDIVTLPASEFSLAVSQIEHVSP